MKALRNNILLLFLTVSLFSFSQDDSLPYVRYKEKIVWYTDLGFSTAPFKVKYPFNDDVTKLKYKNNMSAVLGIGVSYKWFALRLGIALPGTIRPPSRYGRTQYYDLGFDFSVKRAFFDVDLHVYNGYAIKNAYRWNDSLNDLRPNELRPELSSVSFSINSWIFGNPHFKMVAFRGKTGAYTKDIHSFYIKPTFNVHGAGSNGKEPLIPYQLEDTNETKTSAHSITAVDLGVVPGMVFVKRWKSYQVGIMGGLGFVVQSKFYRSDSINRGFLGLAPRFDVKFIAGYNQPKYFVMLVTDFDNKSIRFNDLAYRQTFYNIKIVGGIRLDRKKKKQKED